MIWDRIPTALLAIKVTKTDLETLNNSYFSNPTENLIDTYKQTTKLKLRKNKF